MPWQSLGRRARIWRVVHTSWAVVQLVCLGYIWTCAATRRRNDKLWASVALLLGQGTALLVGRGACPMGARQEQWGDPVPLFELALPPPAAKAAVPVLAVVSVAALATVALRRPGLVRKA